MAPEKARARPLPWSREMREAMSCGSFAEADGGVEDPPVGVGVVLEDKESEDADGEATCVGTEEVGCFEVVEFETGVAAGAADERPAPLPSTLPPPIVRLDMAWRGSHEEEERI